MTITKAEKFLTAAEELGWERGDVLSVNGRVDVSAMRGNEVITIWWEDGVLKVEPTYTIAGHSTKLRNASGCYKRMAMPADHERSYRRQRRLAAEDGEAEAIPMTRQPLPFDIETDKAGKVKKECMSHLVVWRNSISGGTDSEFIHPEINMSHYTVKRTKAGRRVLCFCALDGGFRHVALDSILQVR